jgi:hypothetical protein
MTINLFPGVGELSSWNEVGSQIKEIPAQRGAGRNGI